MRRIAVWNDEHGFTVELLTNNFTIAAGTGFFRMYNNRHWFLDVIAGAGIGILSVQAAYWLYPIITKTFFHKPYRINAFLSPYVSPESKGLAFQLTF